MLCLAQTTSHFENIWYENGQCTYARASSNYISNSDLFRELKVRPNHPPLEVPGDGADVVFPASQAEQAVGQAGNAQGFPHVSVVSVGRASCVHDFFFQAYYACSSAACRSAACRSATNCSAARTRSCHDSRACAHILSARSENLILAAPQVSFLIIMSSESSSSDSEQDEDQLGQQVTDLESAVRA